MESGKRLDLYRELYGREVERQNTLIEGVNGIITVATVLGGAIVFLLGFNPPGAAGAWLDVFRVALALGALLLVVAITLLVAAWTGLEHQPAPDAKMLEEWWKEIERFDLLFRPGEYDRRGIPAADARFEQILIQHYIEAAQFNRKVNLRTGALADRSKVVLSAAALALVIAVLPRYILNTSVNATPGGNRAREENSAATASTAAHGAVALRK